MTDRMRILTVVGTRPEIIRLSRVIARMEADPQIEHVSCTPGRMGSQCSATCSSPN